MRRGLLVVALCAIALAAGVSRGDSSARAAPTDAYLDFHFAERGTVSCSSDSAGCCAGKTCPYAKGTCCSSGHCCREGFECVPSDNGQANVCGSRSAKLVAARRVKTLDCTCDTPDNCCKKDSTPTTVKPKEYVFPAGASAQQQAQQQAQPCANTTSQQSSGAGSAAPVSCSQTGSGDAASAADQGAALPADQQQSAQGAEDAKEKEVGEITRPTHEPKHHDWGYIESGGDWSGTCKDGQSQSPINIVTADVHDAKADSPDAMINKLDIHYSTAPGLAMVHNGHALQVSAKSPMGFVNTLGAKWNVLQFHFHAPSEHQIDGSNAAMEMHIVHQKEGSTGTEDLLVIAVLFEEAEEPNQFLDSLQWSQRPVEEGQLHAISTPVNLMMLESTLKGNFYAYHGSLTTPKCDETVQWRIMASQQPITPKQLGQISALFEGYGLFARGNGNNRGPQPLNGRHVTLVHTS